jgi:AcrR family transcriptional regulator
VLSVNASVKGRAGDQGKDGAGGDARRDRWSAHRAQRREEFVAAALRVLDAQGPDVTMDAVAAEAGVTKPVLYRYFSDKTALVGALAEHGTRVLLDRLLPAIGAELPALTRVGGAVGAYFEVIDELPNLYWLIARHTAGEVPGEDDPFQRNRELIASALTALFGDYLREYGLDSGGAEPWAYGVTGLVQSTAEWWLHRRSMSRVHVVQYTTRLIYAALSGVLPSGALDRELEIGAARPADGAGGAGEGGGDAGGSGKAGDAGRAARRPRSGPSLKLVSGD